MKKVSPKTSVKPSSRTSIASTDSPKKPWSGQMQGFFSLTAAVLLFISLISFSQGHAAKNWLGLLGYFLGWCLHLIFGITSYMIPFFLGWMGWRLLFGKVINHPRLKVLYFFIMLVSTGMLLTLLEEHYPSARNAIRSVFYPQLNPRAVPYHLGGSPLYFTYNDLPIFNLKHLFNVTGVAIVFSSTFLASFVFLFRAQIWNLFRTFFPAHHTNPTTEHVEQLDSLEHENEEVHQPEKSKPENSFMRYVKLRMGGGFPSAHSQGTNPHAATQNHHSHHSQSDLLAIQPETNLTVRPSLSLKESKSPQNYTIKSTPNLSESSPSKFSSTAPYSPFSKDAATSSSNSISSLSSPSSSSLNLQPHSNKSSKPSVVPSMDSVKREDNPLNRKDFNSINENLTIGNSSEKGQIKRSSPPKIQRDAKENFSSSPALVNYKIPQVHLLSKGKKVDQVTLKRDLKKQAEVLEETLQSFGIEAKVGQINCGPTITSFEVHPSIGVKVQKIRSLENDIALNMEAKSIRIIAPIPGKAAVGIEVPNPQPQEVSFKEMLAYYQEQPNKFHIPILLGKAVNGDYVMNDLAKMPHCIIAGATGSGKSVCINTIIMSLVMNARPDQIKLLMVDPKKVELTPYTRLPHMIAPVITEPKGACAALHWLVKEMESRYEILKQMGVRNIDAFNNRQVDKDLEAALDIDVPEKMYYIVTIIDELADLMMVATADIETPIARIAQMARAVGIHLILATQRPSREVITGLIKANFPTRISFKVASRINSQIVLDEIGAESLLGNGDMLFLPPGTSQLVRAQGAFIRDEDINAVIKYVCDQVSPHYIIESFDSMGMSDDEGLEEEMESRGDSLYEQAREIVIDTGNASTTFLQRKLKIGYARAASLMDELESRMVIGPAEGGKTRKILVEKINAAKSVESKAVIPATKADTL